MTPIKHLAALAALTSLALPAAASAHHRDAHDRGGPPAGHPARTLDAPRPDRVADAPAEPAAATPAVEGQTPAAGPEPRRQARRERGRRVGFAVVGTGLSGLTAADGALAAPFSLDLRAANRHARGLLGLDRATLRSDAAVELPVVAGDLAAIRFEGVTDGTGDGVVDAADVLREDRVKVVGTVTRLRTGAYAGLDVRRVIVTRETEAPDAE